MPPRLTFHVASSGAASSGAVPVSAVRAVRAVRAMRTARGFAVLLLFASTVTGCQRVEHEPAGPRPAISGDYLGQTAPGLIPELFAPGLVCTGLEQRDAAWAPDGREFFYSHGGPRSAIVRWQRRDGRWRGPQIAGFSGLFNDIEPAFGWDGSRLYFASNRPRDDGTEMRPDYDIWYVERQNDGWSAPTLAPEPVTSEHDEFYPSLTRDGVLYFTGQRENGFGAEDIWRAPPRNGGWGEPECLPAEVNSAGFEFNAFVAPDESYLLFTSWQRAEAYGGGDLYVAFRDPDGSWHEAVNLGPEVNTPALEYCPFVTADGRWLFFSRKGAAGNVHPTDRPLDLAEFMAWTDAPGNGQGDIYWVDAAVIDRLRP